MKKIILSVLCAMLCITAVGCATDYSKMVNKRVVESRESFFVGECAKYYTTFVCGTREEPYLADGNIGAMVPFGVLTFSSKSNEDLGLEKLNYYILLDNIEYEGELEKSPFNNSYSTDIERLTDTTSEISVRLYVGDFDFQCKLDCVSKDFKIKQPEAINIAIKNFTPALKTMIDKKELNAEIYIKIWKDFSSNEKQYFWYIGVVGQNKTLGILISTETGEVISIKQ